jgi:hypothetical protein
MNVIAIEEKTYEVMKRHFDLFVKEIEQLCGGINMESKWLDNQEVCLLLQISKRTLQYYRDSKTLPFSRFGAKCFYKASDVEKLLYDSQIK